MRFPYLSGNRGSSTKAKTQHKYCGLHTPVKVDRKEIAREKISNTADRCRLFSSCLVVHRLQDSNYMKLMNTLRICRFHFDEHAIGLCSWSSRHGQSRISTTLRCWPCTVQSGAHRRDHVAHCAFKWSRCVCTRALNAFFAVRSPVSDTSNRALKLSRKK